MSKDRLVDFDGARLDATNALHRSVKFNRFFNAIPTSGCFESPWIDPLQPDAKDLCDDDCVSCPVESKHASLADQRWDRHVYVGRADDVEAADWIERYTTAAKDCRAFLAASIEDYGDTLIERWTDRSIREAILSSIELLPDKTPDPQARMFYDDSLTFVEKRENDQLCLLPYLNYHALLDNPGKFLSLLHCRTTTDPCDFAWRDLAVIDQAKKNGLVIPIFNASCVCITRDDYGTVRAWNKTLMHDHHAVSWPQAQVLFNAQMIIMQLLARIVSDLIGADAVVEDPPIKKRWPDDIKKELEGDFYMGAWASIAPFQASREYLDQSLYDLCVDKCHAGIDNLRLMQSDLSVLEGSLRHDAAGDVWKRWVKNGRWYLIAFGLWRPTFWQAQHWSRIAACYYEARETHQAQRKGTENNVPAPEMEGLADRHKLSRGRLSMSLFAYEKKLKYGLLRGMSCCSSFSNYFKVTAQGYLQDDVQPSTPKFTDEKNCPEAERTLYETDTLDWCILNLGGYFDDRLKRNMPHFSTAFVLEKLGKILAERTQLRKGTKKKEPLDPWIIDHIAELDLIQRIRHTARLPPYGPTFTAHNLHNFDQKEMDYFDKSEGIGNKNPAKLVELMQTLQTGPWPEEKQDAKTRLTNTRAQRKNLKSFWTWATMSVQVAYKKLPPDLQVHPTFKDPFDALVHCLSPDSDYRQQCKDEEEELEAQVELETELLNAKAKEAKKSPTRTSPRRSSPTKVGFRVSKPTSQTKVKKEKIKTKGTPDDRVLLEEEQPEERPATPKEKIRDIDKKDLRVFAKLFGGLGAGEKAQKINWTDMLNAMVAAGCSYSQGDGVSHTFRRESASQGRQSILLHRPHSGVAARHHENQWANHLKQRWGWNWETFST